MPGFNAQKDIQKMIERYVDGTATAEEIAFVESYYAWQEKHKVPELSEPEKESLRQESFKKITAQLRPEPQSGRRVHTSLRVASIAAVLLIATTTTYLFFREAPGNKIPIDVAANKSLDIAPGTNKATLTLADGSTITLDDKADGPIKALPGLVITKTQKGELLYTLSVRPDNVPTGDRYLGKETSVRNNTVTTPRGGQYQVILPDATHVWLNAASTLTYPESFAGKTRWVKLDGEAYFEVAKNKAIPFHVFTGGQDVEVTGTHFNINGYMEERAIRTTLLEGGVTVHHQGHSQRISPGQQAVVLSNSAALKVKEVDTEEVVAWKNGLFQFNNASLEQIMSQLERWYDIKVDYSSLPAKRYNGMVPRSANLSRVLKMLELTGDIKFKIDNNRQLRVLNE
jgi:transmembrane sensor